MTWIMAFTLTQVLEIIAGSLIWREKTVSWFRKVCIIFGASLITHPMVWFVFPSIRHDAGLSYGEYLFMAESYAYSVEALYYYVLRVKRPVLLSVVANTCSFLTGVLLYEYVL